MWMEQVFLLLILAVQISYTRNQEKRCVHCVPIDPDNCEGKLDLYPFENLHQNFT